MDFVDAIKLDNLVIIDLLNLCFRYKHKNVKNFSADLINTIHSFGRSYKAKEIIVACDWGSS